jgi:hypothetical protein
LAGLSKAGAYQGGRTRFAHFPGARRAGASAILPRVAPRFSPVFLLGKAHCGSTLLLRLLGKHPDVLAVGELMRVSESLERGSPCTCGALLAACPFWMRYLPWLAELGNDGLRFGPELYRRIGADAGRAVVLDDSKTLAWRARRRADARTGYVFMLRDSRGVLAAALRAGREADFPEILRRHEKWMKRLARLAARRAERTHVLSYEDLCADPERELSRVSAFLGIPFDPLTLTPAREALHLVGASGSSWQKGAGGIRLDERWREELFPEHRAAIERVMARVPILRARYLPAEATRA